MNILFFLTPKCEVAYIYEDETLRQALEKMEYHKYSAVPIISRTGRYIGTITEGDMLWGIKNKFKLKGGRACNRGGDRPETGQPSGICQFQYGRFNR